MATAELPQAEDPVERERREIKARMVRALWIPVVALLGVVFYIVNFSRILISGRGNPAIVVAALVTVAILGGATMLSAAPRMRTSSLLLIMAGALVALLGVGSVVAGHADEKKAAAGPKTPPFGPVVGTLTVTAESTLTFDKKEYSLTGGTGTYAVDYIDGGGTHTLDFDDPTLTYFELKVPGGPTQGKVNLVAGKSYTVFCTIPGHRAAGMQATVTVLAGGAKPAAGATTASSGATTPSSTR